MSEAANLKRDNTMEVTAQVRCLACNRVVLIV